MSDIEVTSNGNKEDEMQAFLDGIGFNPGTGGDQPLILPPEVKHTNAALLASVPDAKNIYESNKIKGVILDLMNRTKFNSFDQMMEFEDYVDWCEEFGVGFDRPLRILAGLPSIEGKSRTEYLAAISQYLSTQFSDKRKPDGSQFKTKYREGELA